MDESAGEYEVSPDSKFPVESIFSKAHDHVVEALSWKTLAQLREQEVNKNWI
jgi:hypothetical protein